MVSLFTALEDCGLLNYTALKESLFNSLRFKNNGEFENFVDAVGQLSESRDRFGNRNLDKDSLKLLIEENKKETEKDKRYVDIASTEIGGRAANLYPFIKKSEQHINELLNGIKDNSKQAEAIKKYIV
ncbi:hypothetical protein, partial [Piscirickettsia litoralis]|uniref:hypothetical protein n=1 Tax=Piscirickettsia litoralis TaxID=1891921 RepID=UPI001F2FF440